MSSGVPTLPQGLVSPIEDQSISTSPPPPTPVLNIQVGNGPGAIALTIIFSLTNEAAKTLVRW